MNRIEWLKEKFKAIEVSFDNDTLTKIDKTIQFSASCFGKSYKEIFYSVINFMKMGDDIDERRFEGMDIKND